MRPDKTEIRKIREHLRYSYQEMADELKLLKATYQGYDTGDRPTPADVLAKAQEARVRVDAFMAGLGDRVIANLKGGICPNEARAGEW
jgi:transcriptional regulator with XRE-family HTH domain